MRQYTNMHSQSDAHSSPNQFAPNPSECINFRTPDTTRMSLLQIIRGFTIYLQRSPCSLELQMTCSPCPQAVEMHFGPYTTFIVLPTLRTVLIVNSWYASHEHYFFRNISSTQKIYRKRPYTSPSISPSIMFVYNIDPRSVFVTGASRNRDICITDKTTFFSLL